MKILCIILVIPDQKPWLSIVDANFLKMITIALNVWWFVRPPKLGSNFVFESSSHGVAQFFFFRKTFHHNKISFIHARDISVIKHLFLQIRYRCSETAQITRATSRRPCTRVFPVSCTEKRAFYLRIGQSSSICDGRSSSKSLCWLHQAQTTLMKFKKCMPFSFQKHSESK